MEWTALNIIVFVLFALSENALYLIIGKSRAKSTVILCSVFSVVLYTAALCYLLLCGATLKQTALVILASLPAAFIAGTRAFNGGNGK